MLCISKNLLASSIMDVYIKYTTSISYRCHNRCNFQQDIGTHLLISCHSQKGKKKKKTRVERRKKKTLINNVNNRVLHPSMVVLRDSCLWHQHGYINRICRDGINHPHNCIHYSAVFAQSESVLINIDKKQKKICWTHLPNLVIIRVQRILPYYKKIANWHVY